MGNVGCTMVRSAFFALTVISMPGAAWAQNQIPHSPAEERACREDAHRFCRDELDDQFKIASCLQMHQARLSRACRSVLEGHNM
jgi:hypothetical protein